MKVFKKSLSLILSVIMLFSVCTSSSLAKSKFTTIKKNKTITGRIEKKNSVDYYKLTLKKKSKVSLVAWNGNLENYYKLKCVIYKNKKLTKRVHKTTLRVTDTDIWCPYKKLKAGTYYITLTSKNKFKYYLGYDVIPVKKK